MATIKKFEELEIWTFAREAENYIYQLTLTELKKRNSIFWQGLNN
jgi:hypothetical protein